jgi:hypothetical protein
MQTNDDDGLSSLPIGALADWMNEECAGVAHVALVPQLRCITSADLTAQTVPGLLAVAFDEGQTSRARLAALDAILAKFNTPAAIPSPEELQARWADLFRDFPKVERTGVTA